MGKTKIVLVEDEESLGYLLSEYLSLKEFEVEWIRNPLEVLPFLREGMPELVILDVMMPGMDGFELAANIKAEFPGLHFLFLTARTQKVDALKAFSLGAVDYLRKPIDEEELLIRIRAILERLGTPTPSVQPEGMAIGSYTLDPVKQLLHYGESQIHLTAKESQLLSYLAGHRNQICTYETILVALWGVNDLEKKKSLNVFITRLRKYLKEDPQIRIINVHGRGFILKGD